MTAGETSEVRRPSRWLLAAEGPRAVSEFVLLQAARPLLASAPRGDGHQVLVLPGLGASDRSTIPLRRFLRRLGYRVHDWTLGTNIPSTAMFGRLRERLDHLREQDPEPMSLVGWSLGGAYARRIARGSPEMVRTVITLGTPFRSLPGYESNAAPVMRVAARSDDVTRGWSGGERPLPVPSTSVFSRTDGVVPWRACLNSEEGPHETIEILASHCGLGHHPAALFVIADRLAQAPGEWTPMRIPAAWRPLLRHHENDPVRQ